MNTSPSRAFIMGGLLLNLACSLTIVFLNKWLYSRIKFPNITLTCIHFMTTSLGLVLCHFFGVFQPKKLPLRPIVPLSLTFCGFVVFTNLSLQSNTVGTYQLAKALTTPLIIFVQSQFYGQTFSKAIKATMIPIVFGIFLNSCFDIKFNIKGTLFALCGVVVTSMYQILVGSKQKELEANSMQLLYYQAPLSSAMLLCIIPFFEPLTGAHGTLNQNFDSETMYLVLLSACTAFFVNLTIFFIIGSTSPVTYNMFGHLKFCLTLLIGSIIFKEPIRSLQFLGILITLTGIFSYTYLKLKLSAKTKKYSDSGEKV